MPNKLSKIYKKARTKSNSKQWTNFHKNFSSPNKTLTFRSKQSMTLKRD